MVTSRPETPWHTNRLAHRRYPPAYYLHYHFCLRQHQPVLFTPGGGGHYPDVLAKREQLIRPILLQPHTSPLPTACRVRRYSGPILVSSIWL